MDIARQPVELADNDRALGLSGGSERRSKLRPAVERVGALAGFNLGEGMYDLEAYLPGKARDGTLLRVQAKA